MSETPERPAAQPEASGQAALVERLREIGQRLMHILGCDYPDALVILDAASALATASAWQPPATAPLDTPVFAYWESPTGYREYAVLRQSRWGNPEVRIWRNGGEIVNPPTGWMLPPGGEVAAC